MSLERLDVEAANAHQRPSRQGLLLEIWSTGAWRLFPVALVYVFSVAILLPAKPDILTDFFASQQAGRRVDCDINPIVQQPQVCQNAHSDAVWWNSFSDFASHSIVTFLLAPLIGRWSDRKGRRPFMFLYLLVASVPTILMAAHINLGVSLYYYFPAQALAGTGMFVSLCTAYISDLVAMHHRASAIGLIMASIAVGILVGPAIGGVAETTTASLLAMVGTFVALILFLVLVRESLSNTAKQSAAEMQRKESPWSKLPWNCLRILGRSELFIKLTICTGIIGFVSLGLLEMLAQYLQLKLNYTKFDLAILMITAGASGLLTQTVILKILMKYLGETRILIAGSLSRVIEQLILCAALDRATVMGAVAIGALANLSMPAVSSLISKNSELHEQGTAQGALYGALALSQGSGPLIFAYLFSGFTRSDSTWVYFPGAPFLVGAFLMVICTLVACTIKRTTADRGISRDERKTGNDGDADEAIFTLNFQSSADLATAGGVSLIQRQPSHTATDRPISSSLENETPKRRSSLDQSLKTSRSMDSRLPERR